MDKDLDIIVLNFADSKIPEFKESRNNEIIRYGADNNYPSYLTTLFNKSAKHNAIITGKANYIFGEGYDNGDFPVNRLGETLNDIAKKAILDIEIYGGFRLEVIWNRDRSVGEIYHVDYTTIRVNKDASAYYFKPTWEKYIKDTGEEIPAFNPSEPYGSQIYAYNEYRPETRYYPLPSYIGANNYIETDIEISKFYLSSIRNGMAPSKMIQFFQGEPTEQKKKQIEDRFKSKFAGSENAGQFILVFGNDKNKSVQIDDLSGSELDKMFQELNKTVQQEIYAGHNIVSPMLFGIKTEGQLGGASELKLAYDIFVNTYAKPKADAFSREITFLLSYSRNAATKYELRSTDPVGLQLNMADFKDLLPKTFILRSLGVPEEDWGNIPQEVETAEDAPKNVSDAVTQTNEHIKNLTAKQHQELLRIIRQYSKGQLAEPAARTLLKAGLGLTDADIDNLLGIESKFSEVTEDEVIELFDSFGEDINDYEILKTKKVAFDLEEAAGDEEVFKEGFSAKLSISEQKILELIKKDGKITPAVIGQVIGQTEKYVTTKINALVKKGYIEAKVLQTGIDTVIERTIVATLPSSTATIAGESLSRISIKYSYEGPKDNRNRPFCRKLLELNRLYTRREIEQISEKLGYSVFDRRGGWWTKPSGERSPSCRHSWKSNIVLKKASK